MVYYFVYMLQAAAEKAAETLIYSDITKLVPTACITRTDFEKGWDKHATKGGIPIVTKRLEPTKKTSTMKQTHAIYDKAIKFEDLRAKVNNTPLTGPSGEKPPNVTLLVTVIDKGYWNSDLLLVQIPIRVITYEAEKGKQTKIKVKLNKTTGVAGYDLTDTVGCVDCAVTIDMEGENYIVHFRDVDMRFDMDKADPFRFYVADKDKPKDAMCPALKL